MEHAFDTEYWDQIWRSGRGRSMATTQPNPHLVRLISTLAPGVALEAGCGAGAEAIWLADRGWQVTGVDIAADALDIAADARTAGLIDWVQADLSVWEPETEYDLVTTHYAHPAIPQLDFYERIAEWVRSGGTLLIVGHRQHDDRHGGHEHHVSGPPTEASVSAADVVARLSPDRWDIVSAEEPSRTLIGPDSRETVIHDVVVMARSRG